MVEIFMIKCDEYTLIHKLSLSFLGTLFKMIIQKAIFHTLKLPIRHIIKY